FPNTSRFSEENERYRHNHEHADRVANPPSPPVECKALPINNTLDYQLTNARRCADQACNGSSQTEETQNVEFLRQFSRKSDRPPDQERARGRCQARSQADAAGQSQGVGYRAAVFHRQPSVNQKRSQPNARQNAVTDEKDGGESDSRRQP